PLRMTSIPSAVEADDGSAVEMRAKPFLSALSSTVSPSDVPSENKNTHGKGPEVNNRMSAPLRMTSIPSAVEADDGSAVEMRIKLSSRAQVSPSQNNANVSESWREGFSETAGDSVTPETGRTGANRASWPRSYIDYGSNTVLLTHNRLWNLQNRSIVSGHSRRSISEWKPLDVSKLKSEE
ncbi:hypothetical protein, partial [Citrobacter portucalensis]|uniref:hypothetical protein n=1 Tax=Citrobacter portucalensis TaxID=1639133 RepID=UPI00226B69D1